MTPKTKIIKWRGYEGNKYGSNKKSFGSKERTRELESGKSSRKGK